MTREIKFRSWDNKNKYFIGNDLLFAFANCALYYQRDKVIELRDGLQNPYLGDKYNELEMDLIYLQYTGLKDINGREIYEGDVVYICGLGNYLVRDIRADYDTLLNAKMENDLGEIIGNIYRNPELLKEEENDK